MGTALARSDSRAASRGAFIDFASEDNDVAEIPIQRKEGRNVWPLLIGLLVLAAILWYVFSHRNNSTDTAAVRADSTAGAMGGPVKTDSAGGAVASTPSGSGMTDAGKAAGATSATSPGAMTDADIAGVIHEVNAGEISAARMAETKSSNADVKKFAEQMVKEHSALDKKDSRLMTGGKSSAGDSVVAANQKMTNELQSAASGAAFDKAYVDGQVTGHENALAFLKSAESRATDAKTKGLVSQAIPDVEKHLASAKALQKKVGQ